MKKQSNLKKSKKLGHRKAKSNIGFISSSVWVRDALHENKMLLQSARANTTECVTIKPPKEVFDAIVAEMLSKKSIKSEGGCL